MLYLTDGKVTTVHIGFSTKFQGTDTVNIDNIDVH
jgi:hypothetical protein